MKTNIERIQPLRRADVINTCNVIRRTLELHGQRFKMSDFGGTNYHVKMLMESGVFNFSRLNVHTGHRPIMIEFIFDKKTASDMIEDYLENTYAARVFEAQEKVRIFRDARKKGLAPETTDTPTEPAIERIGNCTIFRMSQAKHWQRSESKNLYIPAVSTLGGNTLAMTM